MNSSDNNPLTQGIIVGADNAVEWLLPWWWYHYSSHNTLPVVFFDFGLSEQAKLWCKEKGTLIPITPELSLLPIASSLVSLWEKTIGPGLWKVRSQWFKKPFACLASPFTKTLWIDLDCEIRGSLSPLFQETRPHFSIAAESDSCQHHFQTQGLTYPDEITYNSGVIAFTKNHPILLDWKTEVCQKNNLHMGDQNALSRVLWNKKHPFTSLAIKYNWDPNLGPNTEALIFHWSAMSGKKQIYEQIMVLSSLSHLFS